MDARRALSESHRATSHIPRTNLPEQHTSNPKEAVVDDYAEAEMANYGGDEPKLPAAIKAIEQAMWRTAEQTPTLSSPPGTTPLPSPRKVMLGGAVGSPGRNDGDGAPLSLQKTYASLRSNKSVPPLFLQDPAFDTSHQLQRMVSAPPEQFGPSEHPSDTHRSSADTAVDVEKGKEGVQETLPPAPENENEDPNLVRWPDNDPENPQNWSKARKWGITIIGALLTVNVTFASSAPASTSVVIQRKYGVSDTVSYLITTLFLIGYVLGPVIWAPLSEMFGRRPVFIIAMFVYMIFQLGEALGKSLATVLVIRFLSGVFAAAPLTNSGGLIADMWDAVGRGPAMSVFVASVFLGPVIGPIIGTFVTQAEGFGWRWVFWVIMIWAAASWVLAVVALPETYSPVLLARRAKALRKQDPENNKLIYAAHERADFSFKSIVSRTLGRPFVMLFKEPILLLVTIYLSVVYGLLYALFEAFPIIWYEKRGLKPSDSSLIFIGVGIGTTCGALLNVRLQRHYKWLVPKWHGHPPPEERLIAAMVAGPALVLGIFFLGFTGAYPSIPWYVPALATPLLGMSFTLVFISCLAYVVDCYLMYSASALAANTIVRSLVGAAFPLFTAKMFHGLGIQWACTLVGGVAILISPSPFIFFYYGHRIRAVSSFAPGLDLHIRAQVEEEERYEAQHGPNGQLRHRSGLLHRL